MQRFLRFWLDGDIRYFCRMEINSTKISDNNSDLRAEILGSSDQQGSEPYDNAKGKLSIFPIVLMTSGFGFLGFAGFTFIKQRKREYNLGRDENSSQI